MGLLFGARGCGVYAAIERASSFAATLAVPLAFMHVGFTQVRCTAVLQFAALPSCFR